MRSVARKPVVTTAVKEARPEGAALWRLMYLGGICLHTVSNPGPCMFDNIALVHAVTNDASIVQFLMASLQYKNKIIWLSFKNYLIGCRGWIVQYILKYKHISYTHIIKHVKDCTGSDRRGFSLVGQHLRYIWHRDRPTGQHVLHIVLEQYLILTWHTYSS